jgi:hypothetical protein
VHAEYLGAREQLLGLAGVSVFISYAAYVLINEPAHEAAHPHYSAPYAFAKRNMELGAGWWPGRHCQFFEMNCFAQAYEEAEHLLKEAEKEAKNAE